MFFWKIHNYLENYFFVRTPSIGSFLITIKYIAAEKPSEKLDNTDQKVLIILSIWIYLPDQTSSLHVTKYLQKIATCHFGILISAFQSTLHINNSSVFVPLKAAVGYDYIF